VRKSLKDPIPSRLLAPTLVFVTQKIDSSDPILGFVVEWVKALSQRTRELVVITNEAGDVPLGIGARVLSLRKEQGAGRLARGVNYQLALMKVFGSLRPDALIAHMCPIYLNLAAPAAKALRIKTMLWFAHPSNSRGLGIAERMADQVITSFPGAYPRSALQALAIGQGIDMDQFPYSPRGSQGDVLQFLALGRTSPSKCLHIAIEAMSILDRKGIEARLRLVGPSMTAAEKIHREELRSLIRRLGIEQRVSLEDGIPYAQAPDLIRGCDVLVNTTWSGSGDKVILQAMASGRPAIVSNPVFASLLAGLPLELAFSEGDAKDLARRMEDLICHREELDGVGKTLRDRVERDHSVDHWADQVISTVLDLRVS
jgi:glycosyltransferase involved in cell wall biosynthesis